MLTFAFCIKLVTEAINIGEKGVNINKAERQQEEVIRHLRS